MRRVVLVVVVLGLTAGVTRQSRADLIPYHAHTLAVAPDAEDDQKGHLSSNASASGTATSGSAVLTGSASASSAGVPGGSFTLTEIAQASANQFGYGVVNVSATAQWDDVAFLSNTNTSLVGNTLRFNFTSYGTLSTADPGIDPRVIVNVSAYNGQDSSQGGAGASFNGILAFSGFDSVSSNVAGDSGSYSGTFHIDIPISGINSSGGYLGSGGVLFEIIEEANIVGGFQGANSAYADDPTGLRLQSVTLPDVGNVTPESLGVSLTFDSGILSPNLQSVPEPSTLTLALISTLGLLACGWRRRRPSVTQC